MRVAYVLALFIGCSAGILPPTEGEKACAELCAPQEVKLVAEDLEEINLCACFDGKAFADDAEKLTGEHCIKTCDLRGGVEAFGTLIAACVCEE